MHAPQFFFAKFPKKYARNIRVYTVVKEQFAYLNPEISIIQGLCVHACICAWVCVCAHLGFWIRQVFGVECGLFSIHAPLGQTTLRVGRVWDDDDDEKKGKRWNPVLAHSLLFSKSTKMPPGLTSPSDRLIAINSNIYAFSTYTVYCGRVWNLIQACDVQSSPKVEKFSNENLWPCRGSNPGPTEPETDMLPSEPAWHASVI